MMSDQQAAAMEFIKPGSSVPFEIKMDIFAKICNDTKRASFYITKNVRTRKWRIHLSGIHKDFIGTDLVALLDEAGQYVVDNTKESESHNILMPQK